MSTRENAPADHRGASNPPTETDSSPSEAALFAAARGYCVIVRTDHGKYRRRLYLSLSAAENAVDRARAHNRYACMVLAVVVPTGVAE